MTTTDSALSPTIDLDRGASRQASLWGDAWRRLIRNKLAVVGLAIIVFLCLVAIFAPLLAKEHYTEANFDQPFLKPSLDHPFGTDNLGRDMLSRIIWGARVSLGVAIIAQLLTLAIGLPIGAVAGYLGGRWDTTIMRGVDVMYAFPRLLFVLLLMVVLGPGLMSIFIAIGVTGWVTESRLLRAQFLSLKERDFIRAARVSGTGGLSIVMRHLMPNSLTPIIVAMTFGIPAAIFTEAGLSFIGVGIRPPTPSWGQMVGENQQYIRSFWWLEVFPAAAIGITMLAFTFFGDGLRDALDPKMKGQR
jgi:ABC-type dipeptide/oligopeptide/nickel transport system permease subunit